MPRPKKHRRICARPAHRCFKPNGVSMRQLESVELYADEFEALRLSDYLQLNQIDAAAQMNVSRQTFGNIINRARKKVAGSLVLGQALMLENVEDHHDYCNSDSE